jgi:hypothetical protein
MKKKLLKPPSGHKEILFLPAPSELMKQISSHTKICVVHQPSFFNPGVSLKFLLLDYLPNCEKEMIFLDTDRVRLWTKVPKTDALPFVVEFLNREEPFLNFPLPEEALVIKFFDQLMEGLEGLPDVLRYVKAYRDIFLQNLKRCDSLKEVLATSFLDYYEIKGTPRFLSDYLKSQEYLDLFLRIYEEDKFFRELFNSILDEYRAEFRFRYKNYPFPKLEEDELPFWILVGGERRRCFKRDVKISDVKEGKILPRAITVTLFLRMYKFDLFIHGVGGANYEWVTDRLIERFFKKEAPPYVVVSGTFLLPNCEDRELPFFYFDPKEVRGCLEEFMEEKIKLP